MSARGPLVRCAWATAEVMHEYHDREWGTPVHDDRVHFEFLVLEGAQAGLSWQTILMKRPRYREVLHEFDPARVARYDKRKLASLLRDPGIVRNRLKVESLVKNARAFLAIQDALGSFDAFVWPFVGGKPLVNQRRGLGDLPASTPESDALSRALKTKGFTFVGTTICYAYMQAVGLVNDHAVTCFRYAPLSRQG